MSQLQNELQGNHDHIKEIMIIVNTREKIVTAKELSYNDIVALAFDQPSMSPDVNYTIVYRKGENDKKEGRLVPGDTIKIKEGMIFNVTTTNRA